MKKLGGQRRMVRNLKTENCPNIIAFSWQGDLCQKYNCANLHQACNRTITSSNYDNCIEAATLYQLNF